MRRRYYIGQYIRAFAVRCLERLIDVVSACFDYLGAPACY